MSEAWKEFGEEYQTVEERDGRFYESISERH
jgi:hypothetical protein